MSDAWGEVLTMDDGTKADVVPLLEDRAALASTGCCSRCLLPLVQTLDKEIRHAQKQVLALRVEFDAFQRGFGVGGKIERV